MFPFLGFFDWRAIFIEYYKQSLKYLGKTGQVHPPYISVNLIRKTQERILSELARRPGGSDERRIEEERNKMIEKERKWLTSLGLIFQGNRGFEWSEVMFMDIRDIALNPHFASMMQRRKK